MAWERPSASMSREMGNIATIIWLELARGELRILKRSAERCGARVEHTTRELLPQKVLAASRLGAVLVVVEDDVAASQAFRLGAAGVLRAGEIDPASVRRAIHDTYARSVSIRLPESERSDTWEASRLMLEALCDEVSALLTHASTSGELLSGALPTVLAAGDQALSLAGRLPGSDAAERLQVLRLTQPSSEEILTYLEEGRGALQGVMRMVDAVYRLQLKSGAGLVPVAPVLRDIAQVLSQHRRSHVVLKVEVQEPPVASERNSSTLVVAVPRQLLIRALLTLLAAAFEAAAFSEGPDREVTLIASPADGHVLFEVRHSGALGPWLQGADGRGDWETELSSVRRTARDMNGELLVDSDLSATTIRLILPAEPGDTVGDAPLSRKRTRTAIPTVRPRNVR